MTDPLALITRNGKMAGIGEGDQTWYDDKKKNHRFHRPLHPRRGTLKITAGHFFPLRSKSGEMPRGEGEKNL